MDDDRTINTEGGDYAEGNIDKRQGSFVGQQTIHQTLPRWLRFLSAFAIIVILFVVVLVANGGVSGIRTTMDAWGVLPLMQPEQPGETLLIVVPFYFSKRETTADAHIEIKRAVEAAAYDAGLANLRIELAVTPLDTDNREGRDAAEQIGGQYNASLVVWGSDTGSSIKVNFLNRRGTPDIEAQDVTISETARTQIANPSAYSQFIAKDLPDQLSFLALFAVGQTFYINQNYNSAIRVIERAVGSIAPGNSVEGLDYAYFRLGWLYQAFKHDTTQARVMYDRAISLDSKDFAAYTNRGAARYDQGDLKGAMEDFDRAIALDVSDGTTYYDRGLARYDQGDLQGAREDYDHAIALNPNFARAYNNRGLVHYDQGDLKGAIEDYDHAIALDDKYGLAYANRGLARDFQDDLKGAIEDYDQAIALDPNYVRTYNNRGIIRFSQDDLKGAIEDFDRAIALDDKNSLAYNNRGLVRFSQDDLKGAIEDYDQAIALDPNYAPAYYNRGVCYQHQDDLALAIADFEQALRLAEDVEVRVMAEEKIRDLQK